MNTKDRKDIKDSVYGEKGTERRDELDRNFESFKIGLLLKKAIYLGLDSGIADDFEPQKHLEALKVNRK